ARPADRHGPPLQHLRPGTDRRRRDPRLHRGIARRLRPDDPRRRLADPRLDVRDGHGERCPRLSRARARRGAGVQHRQPARGGDDLRPRAAHQATERRRGRDRLSAAPLRRCRVAHPEREEGSRGPRLGARGGARRRPREDDRVVQGESTRIRLGWPDTGEAELDEVREVLESGMLTMGPKVDEFEAGLAKACEVEHALAVSSGTAALHLAVLAFGLEPGDEVLVPAYTFPATANVVALAGLRPVLVDVDPETMNIDPAQVEVGPRTKALLAVHLFGRPLPLHELPDLPLLEDAAGALGARYRGRACG